MAKKERDLVDYINTAANLSKASSLGKLADTSEKRRKDSKERFEFTKKQQESKNYERQHDRRLKESEKRFATELREEKSRLKEALSSTQILCHECGHGFSYVNSKCTKCKQPRVLNNLSIGKIIVGIESASEIIYNSKIKGELLELTSESFQAYYSDRNVNLDAAKKVIAKKQEIMDMKKNVKSLAKTNSTLGKEYQLARKSVVNYLSRNYESAVREQVARSKRNAAAVVALVAGTFLAVIPTIFIWLNSWLIFNSALTTYAICFAVITFVMYNISLLQQNDGNDQYTFIYGQHIDSLENSLDNNIECLEEFSISARPQLIEVLQLGQRILCIDIEEISEINKTSFPVIQKIASKIDDLVESGNFEQILEQEESKLEAGAKIDWCYSYITDQLCVDIDKDWLVSILTPVLVRLANDSETDIDDDDNDED